MRALVISAFVVTVFLSAVTVFFAVRTDTLDGEPYAMIAIEPPLAPIQAAERQTTRPTSTVSASVESIPQPTPAQPIITTSTPSPKSTPAPSVTSAPKLTPVNAPDKDAKQNKATTLADQATNTATLNRRPTETAQPIASNPESIADPFFSAEPGLGLGVGNLGPLDPTPATN